VKTNMMNNNKVRVVGGGLLMGCALLIGGNASRVAAQTTESKESTSVKTRNYGAGRDPFRRYEPPKMTSKKAGEAAIPSLQERINLYKAQKQSAMSARMPAPKPTTALLVSEIEVIGISRTPRGYAAIVEATPIKLSYVIYPGEPFYDGQLVAIEERTLIFRHETVLTDGRRVKNVQNKALRQPNAVNAMSSTPGAGGDSVAAVKP
jgi:hypothetical protein